MSDAVIPSEGASDSPKRSLKERLLGMKAAASAQMKAGLAKAEKGSDGVSRRSFRRHLFVAFMVFAGLVLTAVFAWLFWSFVTWLFTLSAVITGSVLVVVALLLGVLGVRFVRGFRSVSSDKPESK